MRLIARIVFHSAGYWGDVMPYVPLANELVARGHDVTYALPKGHHAMLSDERLALADSGNPFCPAHLVDDVTHERLVERNGLRFGGAICGRYYIREWLLPYLRSGVDALSEVGADADLFVGHATAAAVTRIASDALGVPMMTGHLFPMILDLLSKLPSAAHALPGLFVGDPAINRLRRELGLAPIRFNATQAGIHDGMLLLWSARFAPPGRGWSPTWRTTGFTIWEGPLGQRPDPAVDAYLDAGEPPVLVTFGSSAAMVARRLFEAVAVRLDDLGVRALFLTGGADNVPRSMQGRPDVFTFAPLADVLRRSRAVVHSGSHGTNAAALTAGVPSVAVPFLIDQAWNGRRTQQLGLGRMVKGKRRRAERLWDALDAVTGDDAYTSRARAFATELAEEDGVTAACDAIEARVG